MPWACPSRSLDPGPSYRRCRAQGDPSRAWAPVTIILSLVTAQYALQASDRLLTVRAGNRYDPWDRVSNKSVIVLTRDGLISMGYTGPAFVSRATMDGWIAEVLTGQDLGASRRRPEFGVRVGGAGPDGFLAAHLNEVADRLDQAVNARQVTNELTIDYAGLRWQSRKKPAWPVVGPGAHGPPSPGARRSRTVRRGRLPCGARRRSASGCPGHRLRSPEGAGPCAPSRCVGYACPPTAD